MAGRGAGHRGRPRGRGAAAPPRGADRGVLPEADQGAPAAAPAAAAPGVRAPLFGVLPVQPTLASLALAAQQAGGQYRLRLSETQLAALDAGMVVTPGRLAAGSHAVAHAARAVAELKMAQNTPGWVVYLRGSIPRFADWPAMAGWQALHRVWMACGARPVFGRDCADRAAALGVQHCACEAMICEHILALGQARPGEVTIWMEPGTLSLVGLDAVYEFLGLGFRVFAAEVFAPDSGGSVFDAELRVDYAYDFAAGREVCRRKTGADVYDMLSLRSLFHRRQHKAGAGFLHYTHTQVTRDMLLIEFTGRGTQEESAQPVTYEVFGEGADRVALRTFGSKREVCAVNGEFVPLEPAFFNRVDLLSTMQPHTDGATQTAWKQLQRSAAVSSANAPVLVLFAEQYRQAALARGFRRLLADGEMAGQVAEVRDLRRAVDAARDGDANAQAALVLTSRIPLARPGAPSWLCFFEAFLLYLACHLLVWPPSWTSVYFVMALCLCFTVSGHFATFVAFVGLATALVLHCVDSPWIRLASLVIFYLWIRTRWRKFVVLLYAVRWHLGLLSEVASARDVVATSGLTRTDVMFLFGFRPAPNL